jgi:alanine racemase
MQFGPCATVDRSALRHNLAQVRQCAPGSRVMAVVKANAYGHGIVPVAKALISADAFGVARLSEGLALREAGLGNPVVLLEGAFSVEELDAAASHGLELVVHSFEQLQMLDAWHATRRLHVWFKLDTGMNRLGFRLNDFGAAWAQLTRSKAVAPRPKLMTHLASADETTTAYTAGQIRRFRELADDIGLERSVANSAGLLAWPEARLEWVRPGLALYGISPFEDRWATDLGLQPAMTLATRLIAIRDVKAGETVGYGGMWRAERDSRIGIAAIGYGDGYPRHAVNGTPVLVRDQVVRLVGRVSMDMVAVDVSSIAAVSVGDAVVLWGAGLPAEDVANYASTIPYELVCAVNQRVAMEYR